MRPGEVDEVKTEEDEVDEDVDGIIVKFEERRGLSSCRGRNKSSNPDRWNSSNSRTLLLFLIVIKRYKKKSNRIEYNRRNRREIQDR